MVTFKDEALESIVKWNQEAKKEDNPRYFFQTPEFEKLRDGEKCFVFSRKGTGKTAMGERLLRTGDHGYAVALSFKNYPFNELYKSLKDKSYRQPNQYIAGWQFLIYANTAKLMVQNLEVSASIRKLFSEMFTSEPHEALSRRISRWISGGIRLTYEGTGFEVQLARQIIDNGTPLAERAELLKRLVLDNLNNGKYYLVFDELDEDYVGTSSEQEREEYFALLTSLLKAVEGVRDHKDQVAQKLLPVVFLRDDILKQLTMYGDRAKWMSSAISLEWTPDKLKNLVAFRLSRAAGLEPRPFNEIWPDMVQRLTFTNNGRAWDKFDLIASYTLLRPRDFIYYLSQCAERILARRKVTGNKNYVLSGEVLRGAVKDFAQHLKVEIEDEIGGQMPYVNGVLDMLLSQGERDFTYKEFVDSYNAKRLTGSAWKLEPNTVLELLYNFSAIGYKGTRKDIFRYLEPSTDLDITRPLLLHKGLFGARRIV